MFIMQVLASQLHFLANRNAGLAIPPLFWPVNCIKIGGHVPLLSGPTAHSLCCVVDSGCGVLLQYYIKLSGGEIEKQGFYSSLGLYTLTCDFVHAWSDIVHGILHDLKDAFTLDRSTKLRYAVTFYFWVCKLC